MSSRTLKAIWTFFISFVLHRARGLFLFHCQSPGRLDSFGYLKPKLVGCLMVSTVDSSEDHFLFLCHVWDPPREGQFPVDPLMFPTSCCLSMVLPTIDGDVPVNIENCTGIFLVVCYRIKQQILVPLRVTLCIHMLSDCICREFCRVAINELDLI